MGKNLLIKITMGKPPNEMGNCPFAYPLVTPLYGLCMTSWEMSIRKKKSEMKRFCFVVVFNKTLDVRNRNWVIPWYFDHTYKIFLRF
jgi:hypothetical protein